MKNPKSQSKNQNLPKGWRKVKLGEFIEIVRGVSYSSSNLRETENSFYLVNLKNIDRGGGFRIEGLKHYSGECKKEQFVEEGDIVIAMTDLTSRADVIGMPALIPKLDKKACISMDIVKLEIKREGLDKKFLYYLLNTRDYRGWIKGFASGVNVLHLNSDGILEYETIIPKDINEQKRIADILSAFDEKIELNNKINQTLEQMAQEIFKEWFVKFRFPGYEKVKFVDSELGEIPEGWEIGYLGDGLWSEIIRYKVKKFDGEKIYLATADVLRNDIINDKTKITYENRPVRANAEPVLNSIWFAKMINTYKVLFFFEGNKDDINKYILSTGFMGIKALKNLQYYLYLFINSERFHKLKDTLVQGAVQEAITNANIKEIKIVIPTQDIILLFNEKVEPLISKIYRNKQENQSLSALRDLLLPKLMSGEIRV